MAKEEKKTEDEAEEKSGGGNKLLIIIIVVLLLALGGVGFMLWSQMNKAAPDEAAETEPQGPVYVAPHYWRFSPAFLVSYNVKGRQRYLQVRLATLSRSDSCEAAIVKHLPLIKNNITGLLATLPYKELFSEQGKLDLKAKVKDELNKLLTEEGESCEIEDVLLVNMVMQ